MKLPPITNKQKDILLLLYTYRYLDRTHIQLALGHKDKRRVLAWLKDLREKEYVDWIYSTDFIERTKPAIYFLSLNGIRYLKSAQKSDHHDSVYYTRSELIKRYRDSSRSKTFIDRSLLVANCALNLQFSGENNPSLHRNPKYMSLTEAGYMNPKNSYHFLAIHETLRPNLYIMKLNSDGEITANYLLEVFDGSLPRYRFRKRLKAYVGYLTDYEWDGEDQIQPTVLLVCPSITELIYAKRATKKLLADSYAEEGDVRIWFTTTEILKTKGIQSKIWEEKRNLCNLK